MQELLDEINELPLPDHVWQKISALLVAIGDGSLTFDKFAFLKTLADWLNLSVSKNNTQLVQAAPVSTNNTEKRQAANTQEAKSKPDKAAEFLSGFHLAKKFLDGTRDQMAVFDLLWKKGIDWGAVGAKASDRGLIEFIGDCPRLTAKGREFLK